ncbi:MarR family transcriptional regulator [Flexivirga endophytica]|uniref:MarR family transcriptional regulator n=1 Tax=Flexivirga endophytica TaxID=1849103 RepID=A0A916TF93_9MICO|nr:MarR family transcriptional regulator [Flexivirga endophytica]GGB42813.1 MarR family transcriptional regulator [Flexivirga endophytica]GHB64323.1 MarR family transcriptional regulator [Flexivirga endophytica]
MPENDLLDSSYYRPLFQLMHSLDQDIERLYTSRGKSVRSRSVGPLISLSRFGPMTVKDLAIDREVSHSAMSQTISGLTRDGLVRLDPGDDARTRVVSLTPAGEEIAPLVRAEWRATESVLRALDDEIAQPLMRAVEDLKAALEKKPFHERLEEALEQRLKTGAEQ